MMRAGEGDREIVFVGRAMPLSLGVVHHAVPVWAVLIPCALLMCSAGFAAWLVIRLSRGWRFGGDDLGEGGGGGPGPRRPDPPESGPDGEPEWWDQFEEAFAEYVARTRPTAKPTVKVSGALRGGTPIGAADHG
jgi:hypothetical protein